ncbi:18.0 kDa class I heat shock protein-like [Chenopodium quinoa]|uniref:18.0 kDa class I heat shock protein-like n=1 Tax=Chenopodium quinoa TaxID=63459 RepID=UPI000B7726A8|nr:18.0 kDa class I heat shock protein-like [Chenopodium quinoa]XP_021732649.1 18.0 kDa class I heat shock protein-like [Chenopodium quinoa]
MSLIPSFFGNRRSNVFDPFSLDLFDPFHDFPLNNNTSRSLTSTGGDTDTAAFVNTRIDWKETPEAHVFKAYLSGLKKEEVKVQVEDGKVVQISGERNREQEEKNDKWHRVKMEEIKANMENGVLTVTVPKVEEKKPQVKSIRISAA